MALHAEQRGDRRRCNAMLTSARLSDDALLAHALREERLAERVVDFVRARVQQVFTLQEDARLAVVFRELLRIVEIRRTARILAQIRMELVLEIGIILVFRIILFQLVERRHDDFWHVLSAVFSETTFGIHR